MNIRVSSGIECCKAGVQAVWLSQHYPGIAPCCGVCGAVHGLKLHCLERNTGLGVQMCDATNHLLKALDGFGLVVALDGFLRLGVFLEI